jgi:hypothetical protein
MQPKDALAEPLVRADAGPTPRSPREEELRAPSAQTRTSERRRPEAVRGPVAAIGAQPSRASPKARTVAPTQPAQPARERQKGALRVDDFVFPD